MQSKDHSNARAAFPGLSDWAGPQVSIQCLEYPGLVKFRGELCQDFQVFSLLLVRRRVCVHGTATHPIPSSVKREGVPQLAILSVVHESSQGVCGVSVG